MARGLWGASKAFIASCLYREGKRPLLILCAGTQEGVDFWAALSTFLREAAILYFPPLPWGERPSLQTRMERVLSLSDLLQGSSQVMVVPLASLSAPLPPPDSLRFSFLTLYPQRIIPPSQLIAALLERGYRESPQVTEWGEFSRRGGVLDLFPPPAEHAVRVEFFGDEIVSLRSFDPNTQRSIGRLEQVSIPPLDEEGWGSPPEREATLLDYFPRSPLILLDEPDLLKRAWRELEKEEGRSIRPAWEEILQDRVRLSLSSFHFPSLPEGIEQSISFETAGIASFQGKIPSFAEAAKQWGREGYRLRLLCKSAGQAKRLQEALKEYELHLSLEENFFSSSPLALLVGDLPSGFSLPELKLMVISEEEVFGGRPHEVPRP
ncbi:MAG: hypothetical protein QHH30_04105, partial [candidate division NC10 bacterium]|nr:hypothetical protein [candidate division NC10 bacterium]